MITYRAPVATDVEAAMDIATEMTRELIFGPPTIEKIRKLLDGRYFVLAAWDDARIVGFIVAEVCETLVNNERHGHEKTLYVRPSHRGGRIAIRLIAAYESWARSCGAGRVWLSQSTAEKIGGTARFYMRLGYHIMGVNTCKRLST